MRLSYRVELRPSEGQKQQMLQACGNARWAYTWGLRRKQEEYAATGKSLSAIDLHKELVKLKKLPVEAGGVPWMYEASKCAPQEALRNLDNAFQRFFDNCKKGIKPAGYPKPKKRTKGIGGFRLSDGRRIEVDTSSIKLPSLGRVRLMPGEHGYIPSGKYSQASVTEKNGRWYVSVLGADTPEAPPNGLSQVGLDMGVTRLATISDGTVIENPKALAKSKRKLLKLPGEELAPNSVALHMNKEEWTRYCRQADLLETSVISNASDGSIAKIIVRKSQRLIDGEVSWAVMKRAAFKCEYCGSGDHQLTVDHLIPWEDGGPSTEQNMKAACKKDNRTRGNMPYGEWLESPYYKKVSAKLTEQQRQANIAVLATLDYIPRMVHKRSR